MLTAEDIYRTILEDPFSDVNRMAYADFLEENGQDPLTSQVVREGLLTPTSEVVYLSPPHKLRFDASESRINRGLVYSLSLTLESYRMHYEKIFSLYPVTRVVLTDRIPYKFRLAADGLTLCGWRVFEDEYEWNLGKFLWDLLPQSNTHFGGWKCYDTEELALGALSVSCVTYGRKLVGLPEINLPTLHPLKTP